MAKVSDVINAMNELYPENTAQEWDNVGLIIGDGDSEVSRALICLNAYPAEIDMAVKLGCELIISHHPPIFGPIKSVTDSSVQGRIAIKAISAGISIYSAHTNLDAAPRGTGYALACAAGLDEIRHQGLYYIGIWNGDIEDLCARLDDKLKTTTRSFIPGNFGGQIKAAAIPGSGGDLIPDALAKGCNLIITGECGYHEILDANELGMAIIVCGHGPSETPVLKLIKEDLQKHSILVQYPVDCFFIE